MNYRGNIVGSCDKPLLCNEGLIFGFKKSGNIVIESAPKLI